MSSRGLLFVACAVVLGASKLLAQIPAMQQPPDAAYPSEYENWLDSGEPKDRVERLAELGVDRRIAEEFISAEDVYLRWIPIRSATSHTVALLFLPCAVGSDSAYLYALAGDGKTWRVTDYSSFDCHYDMEVGVVVESIRSARFEEILVHHACTGHGTGFLQQEFQVFALAKGKLKLELDTTEVLKTVHDDGDVPRDLDQNSVFVLIPIKESGARAIEETRSKIFNGNLQVDRRLLRWNSRKGRYRLSKFNRVVAARVSFRLSKSPPWRFAVISARSGSACEPLPQKTHISEARCGARAPGVRVVRLRAHAR